MEEAQVEASLGLWGTAQEGLGVVDDEHLARLEEQGHRMVADELVQCLQAQVHHVQALRRDLAASEVVVEHRLKGNHRVCRGRDTHRDDLVVLHFNGPVGGFEQSALVLHGVIHEEPELLGELVCHGGAGGQGIHHVQLGVRLIRLDCYHAGHPLEVRPHGAALDGSLGPDHGRHVAAVVVPRSLLHPPWHFHYLEICADQSLSTDVLIYWRLPLHVADKPGGADQKREAS